MSPEVKIVWQQRSLRFNRPFLQPLAVGLVCAVFIVLILTMGIMDLQRSERTLIGFMEDQGKRIIGVVERLTEENLKTMIIASQRTEGGVSAPLSELVFSPQKLLTEAIVAMGREIDNQWKTEHLSGTYIRRYAEEKNLWLVAVLNAWGDVLFQSRTLSDDLFDGKAPATVKGQPKGTADLINRLNQLNRLKKIGFIALSRKDESGTIIIALDKESLRYWGMRVSVEKAMEKLGEGQGLVYLTVRDKKGMPLGNAGNLPEELKTDNPLVAKILSGTIPFESRKVDVGGKSLFEIVAPLRLGGEIVGTIRLGLDRGNTDQILGENRRNMFIFLTFVVLIALLSMWLLYNDQNRHLAGIVEMTRQLEKAERLSSLGQLAAGVAHEIRNPLNAISMASQRLKREYMPADDEKKKEFDILAGVIRDEIRRLNGIIEEFLTFSKSRRLELRDCPVQEVLQKIVNLISEEAAAKGISLRTDWESEPVVIPMDMDKLLQALLNFVKNAMESISGEGDVTLSIRHAEKGRVSIRVADTGCGITTEEADRIFNPEYTTKEKGLGLGLPLAHEIIRGHGGEIRVLSRKGEGTTFEILLPTERHEEKGAITS
ncbi:MAG: ATP-binding protein [Syntrophales bacterium]|nr:ATP-binding protein [Syntrophales bacterium]